MCLREQTACELVSISKRMGKDGLGSLIWEKKQKERKERGGGVLLSKWSKRKKLG